MFDPEFDTAYAVDPKGRAFQATAVHYIPTVEVTLDIDSDGIDVLIDGMPDNLSEWSTLTGYTGQYGYRGAVMHPSELWQPAMLEELAGLADTGDDAITLFAVVEVRDDDGSYPDGDAIGWAVIYRVIKPS
jgi:hypothetical protein